MAKKRSKGRGTSLKSGFELYGVSDLLKQIEAAGGRVDKACKQAVDKSLKVVGDDMQSFMENHKQTGDTYRSFEQKPAVVENGKISAIVGYNIKEGGLPAIFLDVGTPKRKGYFYRYYAVNNNTKKLKEIQHETLNDILKGLKQ